jgi:flagellar biosynthesis protein FliR
VNIPELAGTQVLAFILVLGRVAPLFLLAPVLSASLLASRAKFVAAAAISLAITPIATGHHVIPTDPLAFAIAFVHEAAVGLAFALALGVIAAAVEAGASLVDTLSGFSLGASLDPITGTQNAVFGQVYSLFAVMIFVLGGGIQLMIMGVVRSYGLVPLGTSPAPSHLAALALQSLEAIPVIGLELVAPVLLALVITDFALGLLARSVPHLNAFMLGLPAKVILAFAIVAASLPFVAGHLHDDLTQALTRALDGLHP